MTLRNHPGLRPHVPPHMASVGAKRRAALAIVFAAEVTLTLIAFSAITGLASPSERTTHSERSDPERLLSVTAASAGNPAARNRAIAALAKCNTDSQCELAEQALRASGCTLEDSGVILCPVRASHVEVSTLPPL